MFYFVGRFSRPILPNAHCDWSVGLFTYKIVKMESEWTDDAVMCLINMYEEHPVLYDKRDTSYRNRDKIVLLYYTHLN